METILRTAMAANVMITLANAENDNKSSDKNVMITLTNTDNDTESNDKNVM